MAAAEEPLDQLCINTIRTLSIDAIQQANSGHPGAPMGLAPAAHVLWKHFLKFNPKNPAWVDRDRFVLSAGHASMLLYSLLYLNGYDLSLEDLVQFRQWGSKTPGHPEYGHTPGVETTTGPLGQGFGNAVGMAMAERHMAARFNSDGKEIIDHYTYVMCGDGDLMEGVAMESASLAGHLGLSRLICLYDDNDISIEGSTDLAFTEDVKLKFESMNWQVIEVGDGNDLEAIYNAIDTARSETRKPSLIKLKTEIAYGSPAKQGSAGAHGAPLGEDEVRKVKEFFNFPSDKNFYVPDEVLRERERVIEKADALEGDWQDRFNSFKKEAPGLADLFADAVSGFLTQGWDRDIPVFSPSDDPVATRAASGKMINAIAPNLPVLMGGSADLAPSNKTYIEGEPDFGKESYHGRNIRFGVREHAMGSVVSGLCLHGGIRPYGGTFLVFADYMRPAIRMAAIMKLPVIYVFTHDSIAVGEDGPTHQPVEHAASLRAIPGLNVIRPADANETARAWKKALETNGCPTALLLSRQKLPHLDLSEADGDLENGAYIVRDSKETPELILIGSGAELHACMEASAVLEKEGVKVRVVSMPSWELFESAPESYRRRILPDTLKKRVAVEAGSPMGWDRYVSCEGTVIGIDTFGASAPGGRVLAEYGFTPGNIVSKAKEVLGR
ncbi:MAG: transketolase [Desulfarculaceae bacterium]|nr:transketolase [Desulfarculaceae bacterium]